jgi:hypothetical protein
VLTVSLTEDPSQVRIKRTADISPELWKSIGRNVAPGITTRSDAMEIVVPLDRFLASRIWLGQSLIAYNCEVEFDEHVQALLIRSDDERREVERALTESPLPLAVEELQVLLARSRFRRELRPFQLRDLAKVLSLSHGANFSIPGSGKTTVTYAVYEVERLRDRVDRLLVVAPISAFDAWFEEAEESLFPEPVVVRFEDRVPSNAEVILLNYQRLASRYTDVAEWVARHRCHVVLDEAHRMKRGRDGEWGSACLNLSQIAVRRDVLTGTPAPQHPSDFIALLNFLWPHRAMRIMPADALTTNPTDRTMTEVSRRLNPFFVRTRKDELGLDPPDLRVEIVEMKPIQAEIYAAMRTRMGRAVAACRDDQKMLQGLGEVVMYLLEAATNPGLLATAVGGDPTAIEWPPSPVPPGTRLAEQILSYARFETPRKFEKLASLVSTNAEAGRKTLVWTNFIANIEEISQRILSPYHPAIVHGGVPSTSEGAPGSREHELSRFRGNDDCMVLVANPAAMAEGVSLHHACHDAIYVDRTFNAGQYLQSLDRIHRLGLPPGTETRMTLLVSEGTIDEIVDSRVRTKAERLSMMLSDPNLVMMALPDEDAYGTWIDEEDLQVLFGHLANG